MNETDLIRQLTSDLSSQFNVPVRTSGFEDEWPVPVIVVDDWDTTDITHHNSQLSHEERQDFDDDGDTELGQWYRFYFDTRVDLLIRHGDEEKASELQSQVKRFIRSWQIHPQKFHADCNRVKPLRSANPRHQFREPAETELSVAASFYCVEELFVKQDLTIEEITKNFVVNA